jgi:hypothetical protein
MRRGCIAIGLIKCDNCKRIIEHGERYLLIAEDNDAEDKKQRICVDCCISKKYGSFFKEKGQEVFSFFTEQ